MPPKPGNAFAQKREMERQTIHGRQQHARDLSHNKASAASNVGLNPQQQVSGDERAQDLPDSPRTTIAIFAEDVLEERPDTSQYDAPLSKKRSRRQKKKAEAKKAFSTFQDPLPTRSSAMPEPLFSEKQSGLNFIKSTFAKGRKAFAKTPPISTPQLERASTPSKFQQRQDGTERPAQPQISAAAPRSQSLDSAATSSSQPALSAMCLPAATPQVSALSHVHAPATTSQQFADLKQHALAPPSQQFGDFSDHGPASGAHQPGPLTRYATGTTLNRATSSSMQIPQSRKSDHYRASTAYGQRNSSPPFFEPYTGMMPYSRLFPRRNNWEGHLSAGTQQTYATNQSKYACVNDKEGIILGHTAISPTRQGSYATAGNVELVSRPSVNSMTEIVGRISPTLEAPQPQTLQYNGPFTPSTGCHPRTPLPSLPASVAENQATCRTQKTSHDASSAENAEGSIYAGHNHGIMGTWERMQAQYPRSMPQISPLPQEIDTQPVTCDPPYITTCDGAVAPMASLYNLNAYDDTKSEGKKSNAEAAEPKNDSDTETHDFRHLTATIKRLLRKSGFRGAFSNEDIRSTYHNSSLNAEVSVFAGSWRRMQHAASLQYLPTTRHITEAAHTTEAETDKSMARPSDKTPEVMLSPDVPEYIQTVAASAGPISTDMPRTNGPPSSTAIQASDLAPIIGAPPPRGTHQKQQHKQQRQRQQRQRQRDSRVPINTTTFGGPSPTPSHPSYNAAVPVSQQISQAFTILHHRLEQESRSLREHVSSATDTGRDAVMRHLDLQMSRITMDLAEGWGRCGERMRALEGEVAALRRELGSARSGGGPLPASGAHGSPSSAAFSAPPPHVPTPGGQAGAARFGPRKEHGMEGQEVLWRRPTGGRVGDIGERWYGEEMKE